MFLRETAELYNVGILLLSIQLHYNCLSLEMLPFRRIYPTLFLDLALSVNCALHILCVSLSRAFVASVQFAL